MRRTASGGATSRGDGAALALAWVGGAGTFDGVFLTGILASILAAWISPRRRQAGAEPMSETGRAA